MHFYTVDIGRVANDPKSLACTRMLAMQLQQQPYTTVSDFFQSLSDEDLQLLMRISEDNEHVNYDDLILMTEMLTAAEGANDAAGTDEQYVTDLTTRMTMFSSYIALESLFRRGMIDLVRQNMSFDTDCLDKEIAVLTEHGRQVARDEFPDEDEQE